MKDEQDEEEKKKREEEEAKMKDDMDEGQCMYLQRSFCYEKVP